MSVSQRLKIDNPGALSTAKDILADGGIIVYPTDTLYGFGVDAANSQAVDKLNQLKGRSGPISVIAPDTETALGWTTLSDSEKEAARPYIGGPKTAILPVKPGKVTPQIMGPGSTLGIRVPDQPFILRLAGILGKPITTTSVNRSGQQPLNDPDAIMESFKNDIGLLIDAGTLPKSGGSTIYRWNGSQVELLRTR